MEDQEWKSYFFFQLDNWLEMDGPLYQFAIGNVENDQINASVHDFIINNKDLNWSLLKQILLATIIPKFQYILAPNDDNGLDELAWYTNDGCFTILLLIQC